MVQENALLLDHNAWISREVLEWYRILKEKDNKAIFRFFTNVSEHIASLNDVNDRTECLELFELFGEQLTMTHAPFKVILYSCGLNAYNNGNYAVAEKAFKILSDCNDPNGRNKYADMLRRGEVLDPSAHPPLEALRVLRESVENCEPFALVYMALTFALCFGTDQDWHLADDLMKKLPDKDAKRIYAAWPESTRKEDIEGVLIHYFLLRHKKAQKSPLGSAEFMSKRLSSELSNFPDWLKTAPRFQSLEDVFNIFLDDDFEECLTVFLEDMPRNRASTEEILRELKQWDEWLLYRAVLQDFIAFMTKEEVDTVIVNYKKKFYVPLSAITDVGSNGQAGVGSVQED